VKHKGPILTVRLTEGLATRNRLPLDHVLRVLSEIKGMLEDASRKVALAEGVTDPDLGIELVAGFRKGSVQADLAITRHTEIGTLAAVQVLGNVQLLRPTSTPSAAARRPRPVSTDARFQGISTVASSRGSGTSRRFSK
jgi:hypothetical protein